MIAYISSELRHNVITYCRLALPNEACGVLTGEFRLNPSYLKVQQFHPITNRSARAEAQFEFDPSEWIDCLYQIRENRQSIVGLLHSHPRAAAVPSELDLDTYWSNIPSHWIVGPLYSDSLCQINAYRYVQPNQSPLKPLYEPIRVVITNE